MTTSRMKKAIIVGATSGIGNGLAKMLAENNYKVGITGRRTELLNELKNETVIKTLKIKHILFNRNPERLFGLFAREQEKYCKMQIFNVFLFNSNLEMGFSGVKKN